MKTEQALAIIEYLQHNTDEEICRIAMRNRRQALAMQGELLERGYQSYIDFGGKDLRVFVRRSESDCVPTHTLDAGDAMAAIVCCSTACLLVLAGFAWWMS